ncbi:hypothetical protein AB4Z54_35245, partial [Streptomyces sp. MCAF7]
LAGELRILLRGVPRWWWAVAAAITVAGLVAPLSAVPRIVLPAAWIWPVLIWSRLGTQRHEYGVESLLGAYPAPGRRTRAEWLSGLAVTALALALGTLSRTHRLFQAGYLPLWYATANGLPLLDFMGAVRANGHPADPPAPAVAALSALLLGAVFAAGAARRGKG